MELISMPHMRGQHLREQQREQQVRLHAKAAEEEAAAERAAAEKGKAMKRALANWLKRAEATKRALANRLKWLKKRALANRLKWLKLYAHLWSSYEYSIRRPARLEELGTFRDQSNEILRVSWSAPPPLICRCPSALIRHVRRHQRIALIWRGLANAALNAEVGELSWQPDEPRRKPLLDRMLSTPLRMLARAPANPSRPLTCREHTMLTRVRLAALAARPGAFPQQQSQSPLSFDSRRMVVPPSDRSYHRPYGSPPVLGAESAASPTTPVAVEPSAEAASAAEAAEVVLPLTFGDIFVQSPAVRLCLLHNCEVESLAVMRQLCSTFMRDVPRVINSKDWQLKHRCVILYKESSRKQRTTFYRRYPQEAGWLAIITGSDMARPDLLMQQLASGMASSRVFSFIWTNFEDSPDSSRLDSSYGKAKKCHPRPHAPPRDIAGGFDADGGGSGGGGGGSVAEGRDERHIERVKAHAMPDYWEKRIATTSPDGFAAILLDPTGRDRRTWAALQQLLQTDPEKLKLRRGTTHDRLELTCAWRLENPALWEKYMSGVQGVMNDMERIRQGRVASAKRIRQCRVASKGALPGDLRVDVNEAFLMHGTNAGVLFNILSQGMNERFAGTAAGAAYGEGSYLAEDAGKNDQYTKVDPQYDGSSELHKRLYAHGARHHPGKVFYILVCRVALGHHVRTKQAGRDATSTDTGRRVFPISFRELDTVAGVSPPVHHHSLLAPDPTPSQVRYREFIVFHSEYIYPEYLLAYQRYEGGRGPMA